MIKFIQNKLKNSRLTLSIFFKKRPFLYLLLAMALGYALTLIALNLVFIHLDDKVREVVMNIIVLILLFITFSADEIKNELILFVIDFYTASVTAVLSYNFFKITDTSFIIVLNEILTVVLIPYAIYMRIRFLMKKDFGFVGLNDIKINDISPPIKLIPNGKEKYTDSLEYIPLQYIAKINEKLKEKESMLYQAIIPIEDAEHLPKLYDAYFKLSEYYKENNYLFSINEKDKKIIIDWKNSIF